LCRQCFTTANMPDPFPSFRFHVDVIFGKSQEPGEVPPDSWFPGSQFRFLSEDDRIDIDHLPSEILEALQGCIQENPGVCTLPTPIIVREGFSNVSQTCCTQQSIR
jgi:hypothetical protein